MKITFLTASLGSGGAERVVSLLANRIAEMGHQIEIICLLYDDVYYKTSPDVKLTIAVRICPGNLVKRLFWLRNYVKTSGTNVCIAFTEGVYCATICALMGTRIPVIASERLDPHYMSWKRKLLKKIFLPHAAWLVVQTEYIKKYFHGSIAKKTSIILNPVNDKVYDIEPCNKENTIISVARLFPQKRQEILIKAFANIAERFPEWKLVIYGEGPERESLESLIESLSPTLPNREGELNIHKNRISSRILLPGRCETVIEEMNKAKIFAFSSDYEGLSNAMLEAVCVGLPIVSTKVSGTDELIRDGVNGYVVNLGDTDALANALERLMTDETKIQSFSLESRNLAEKFRMDNIVEEWLSLIRKVCDA